MTPEPIEIRRKRLRFRAWHRGMRESDLLLGNFADTHAINFSQEQLDRFETLLEVADADIYNWYARREPVPAIAHFKHPARSTSTGSPARICCGRAGPGRPCRR